MHLFLLTIIYCLITQLIKIPSDFAFGIILVVSGFLKGLFSHEFSDFLNLENTKILYKKYGFSDSLMELLSLVLIFINAILIDYEPFNLFEWVVLFVVFATLYRFLFWGIIRTIKVKNKNQFSRG